MSKSISYSCTRLTGTGKQGKLKPDADGYYQPILGALNVYNSAGAYYTLAPGQELMEESGSLMRRITSGNLRGEWGHPEMALGMRPDQYLMRILDVLVSNVSHHIRMVKLVEGVKDAQGNPTIVFLGDVKPSGPKGPFLLDSLENKYENTCFSIRSLTDDQMVGGRRIKNLRQIVTWDFVNEPGIAIANKYSAPTLECLEELAFNIHHLEAVEKNQKDAIGMGMESNIIMADMVEETLSWMRGKLSAKSAISRWKK